MLDWIAKEIYDPRSRSFVVPEGVVIDPTGQFWFRTGALQVGTHRCPDELEYLFRQGIGTVSIRLGVLCTPAQCIQRSGQREISRRVHQFSTAEIPGG